MPESRDMLSVWKVRGETLAMLLARVRAEHGIAPSEKMTYAGRLDPMAEGEVLILVGAARFEKEAYLARAKTYRFEVLLGVSTDTYDVLGIITDTQIPLLTTVTQEAIGKVLKKIMAAPLSYPPFSSKPVHGVPLFVKAKANNLPEALPLQRGTIERISYIEQRAVPIAVLAEQIMGDIEKVEGDFRQRDIGEGWKLLAQRYGDGALMLLSFEATVASGVYIRSIAHEIGRQLGIPALAYTIVRTKIHD